MSQVFTSYSRRDTELVDQIVQDMNEAGLSVWIDREAIQAGNTWRVQIVKAIDTCEAFVLMLSPNSAASDNVRREIDLASESDRIIFAVMLEPVKLPAEIRYQLAGLQFIDVKMLGLEESVRRLIETLKAHIKTIEPEEESATREVELVIQGVDLSAFDAAKQEQLLAFIANLANTDRTQLKLENVTAGSVHAFVRMPTETAYQLKTQALNREPRFKELGITSLRLNGDQKFINVALGKPMLAATVGPLAMLWLKLPALFAAVVGPTVGKLLTVFLITAAVAGTGILVPKAFNPQPVTPTAIAVPTQTNTEEVKVSDTPESTATFFATDTALPSPTATMTQTPTQTSTASATPTPQPTYQILKGVVANPLSESIACRYGPGDMYLYEFGFKNGLPVEVLGQVDVRLNSRSGLGEISPWFWVQGLDYEKPCWVNSKYIRLAGDPDSLETVYPDKVRLPLTNNWPPIQKTQVLRRGDRVLIQWDAFMIPDGERESKDSPRYVVELWLCQDGVLAFTPIGTLDANVTVIDQAGCSEPSHGWIYLAEVHGYVGPTKLDWPQPSRTTPTP